MEFRFDNYAEHVGSRGKYEWYKWKVFMAEPEEKEELEKIKAVEYRLHQTFPDPIRVVENRDDRFALRASGWGEFVIFITIYFEDGSEEHTEYYLDLGKPWPPGEE